MSKELEALKELKHWKETNNENGAVWLPLFAVEDIENSLKRREAIDNANLSEALEDLKELHKLAYDIDVWKIEDIVQSLHIKQALQKAQEQEEDIIHYNGTVENLRRDNALLKDIKNNQEKALMVIFEKMVNILLLELAENVDEYNERIVRNGQLTEEEFNLLKRHF